MASRQRKTHRERASRPARTVEGRESQIIAKAYDLAEKQIDEGTVSSQVHTQFLKMGTTRERMEQDRLRQDNELLKAKVDALKSAKNVEELYGQALSAMREYAGHVEEDENYDDYDEYD